MLERFEGLRECFFECQPGLARGENREDNDAVVGHEEGDEEGLAESDDAHARVMEGECLASWWKVGKLLDVIRQGAHVVARRDFGAAHGRDRASKFSELLPSLARQDQARALPGHFSPRSARISSSV